MHRYAVAHMDFFNNDLKIVIVSAKSEVQALIQGVREIVDDEWLDDWLDSLTSKSIEDIKTTFWESDRLVNVKFIE